MLGFIYSNQSWVIVIGVIVFLLILYLIFKALPAKVNKKESLKKDDKKSSEGTKSEPQKQEVVEIKETNENKEKTQTCEGKSKKDDKKPKIVQVYKRQSSANSEDGDVKKTVIDPIYDRNVEFVNTSKNIAKFKSFAEEKKEEEIEKNIDEYGFVQDKKDDCEFCEDKIKHFDHSKRLSNIMKNENGDEMFGSHISEKYLNINSDRHLNLNEKFNQQLFSMTDKMMKNSENKVQGDGNPIVSSYFGQDVEEDDESDEDVKVNMKTALIADTYFKRKKKKK